MRRANPEAAAQLDALSRALQDEQRERGTRRGKPLPSMVRLRDPSIAATSVALVAMQQQVALVEGAAALVAAVASPGGGDGRAGGGE